MSKKSPKIITRFCQIWYTQQSGHNYLF